MLCSGVVLVLAPSWSSWPFGDVLLEVPFLELRQPVPLSEEQPQPLRQCSLCGQESFEMISGMVKPSSPSVGRPLR
ncbi:hypothetical protein GCM10010218_53160 [Streptomyces mashuensis]|uniref:Uncharacterized protein n=1 Tax=Streptomyces mashuensis TaxID=33904 RepID=A0A919EFE4_9ACTN|nr:hypothetical protein GCM10010218_53160 [Streptomyces mashuensis]